MLCVFLKELRQFRRSTATVVMLILSAVFAVAAIVQYKFKGDLMLSQILNSLAYVVAGLNQMAVITAGGSRWKNENGDGSLDIVYTTPISPLKVSCAKFLATSLCAFAAFPLPVIISGVISQNFSFFKLLVLAFLQVAALSSISLGCSTFQNKKSNSFDWIMLITVLALLPIVSLIYKSFSGDVVNDHFLAAAIGLIALTVAGISFAVCGSSPQNTNRALMLKLTITLFALLLPPVYQKLLLWQESLSRNIGWSLFWASLLLLGGGLFERKLQSRRVLASKYSRWTMLFNTGVANTFILTLILGMTAVILTLPDNQKIYSALAYMLLLTGLGQLERGVDGKKNMTVTPTIITAVIAISSILYIGANQPYKKYISLLLPWMERTPIEASVIATCGILLYLPTLSAAYKNKMAYDIYTRSRL